MTFGASLLVGLAVPAQGQTESGAVDACLRDPSCGGAVEAVVEDGLRRAGMASEPVGIGMSPAMVRGQGVSVEIGVQTVPGWSIPGGTDLLPALPRLAVGGFGGQRIRFGGGIEGGYALPLDGLLDLGVSVGGRGGFALGSPDGRRWVGFEGQVGYAFVEGKLFEEPRSIEGLPTNAIGKVPVCPRPCLDMLSLTHVGLESVMAWDIDETATMMLRLGAVYGSQVVDVALDRSRWRWAGISPRATFAGGYRPSARSLLSASVRLGILEPSATLSRGRVPWLTSLSAGYLFGGEQRRPQPTGVPRAAVPVPVVPRPVVVPKVAVATHPDLDCGEGRLSTGFPPPNGLKGWCVMVTDDGRVVWDGAYLEWYDAVKISRRGQFVLGKETGSWTEYDSDGSLVSQGNYADGLKDGVWTTYTREGQPESEGRYERGKEAGQWMYWWADGRSSVGEWVYGSRNGVWRDYGADGQVVRERIFRDDLLTSDIWY